MSAASEALVKETPEPMKNKLLFLKNSEAQPDDPQRKEPQLDLVLGELHSTPDFPGWHLQVNLCSGVLPLEKKLLDN